MMRHRYSPETSFFDLIRLNVYEVQGWSRKERKEAEVKQEDVSAGVQAYRVEAPTPTTCAPLPSLLEDLMNLC